jgi:peptidoglycan glycosyltransferase
MNHAIGRLTYAFILLFIVISLFMVDVQVFQAPDLSASGYNPRHCLADALPIRGSIYDRHGTLLVYSVRDPNAQCGYRRVYTQTAVNAGLAPLIGYYSFRYGASGLEAAFDDVLNGTAGGQPQDPSGQLRNVYQHLLHKQTIGDDIYLTLDLNLQQDVMQLYPSREVGGQAEYGGVCQAPGSNPAGSVVVEDPNTGEIISMVSRPFYDPNRINDDNTDAGTAYWNQLLHDASRPLLNRATQGLYVPGSTFKTVTLTAGLDTGQYALDTAFSQADATDFVVNGEHIHWAEYNDWVPGAPSITAEQGYAFSDNVVFARMASQLGPDTWLNYVRRFGIATPGTAVASVPFDGPQNQSVAYVKGASFDANLLAESGFGQGQLLISPLTMAEVTSAVAANGNLYVPHLLYAVAPHGTAPSVVLRGASSKKELYQGTREPIMQPQTAAAVRAAMRGVVEFGTAAGGQAVQLSQSPALEGGKSGTGQVDTGNDHDADNFNAVANTDGDSDDPQTWWISLAPDDAAQGGGPAKMVSVVMKEHSGEGACQIFVADGIYRCAAGIPDLAYLQWTGLGDCPANRQQ